MEEQQMVTLKTFNTRGEAEVVASKLRAYGIESTLLTDDAGGMLPSLNLKLGIRLQVLAERAEEAGKILDER